MEPKRYPRQLSRGANNAVIALSETEVGKLFSGDTRSDIGSEAEKMRFANAVNGLVVRFHRLEYNAVLAADMLVMERLYPFDFRAYECRNPRAVAGRFHRRAARPARGRLRPPRPIAPL